jgi:hypothetical protein
MGGMKPRFQFSLGRLLGAVACFAFAAWATNGLDPPVNWIDGGDLIVAMIISFAIFLGLATLGFPPKYSIAAYLACASLCAIYIYYHNG